MIKLNYNQGKSSIIIDGNTDSLVQNRRIRNILNSQFNTTYSDGEIAISCNEANIKVELSELIELLDTFGINYEFENQASEAIKRIEMEEENFNKFSVKAKNIRDSEFTEEEFKDFEHYIDKLKTLLPNRTLYENNIMFLSSNIFLKNNFSPEPKTSIVYASYAYLKLLKG